MAERWRPPPTTPAGWYPDPDDPASLRYWDGYAWSEHRTPPVPVVQPTRTPAWLVPTHVAGWAVASGYLGLVTFIFCGIPGPFAIATGVLGLKQIDRQPDLNGKVRAYVGIVLGSLGTLLLILVAIALIAEA